MRRREERILGLDLEDVFASPVEGASVVVGLHRHHGRVHAEQIRRLRPKRRPKRVEEVVVLDGRFRRPDRHLQVDLDDAKGEKILKRAWRIGGISKRGAGRMRLEQQENGSGWMTCALGQLQKPFLTTFYEILCNATSSYSDPPYSSAIFYKTPLTISALRHRTSQGA